MNQFGGSDEVTSTSGGASSVAGTTVAIVAACIIVMASVGILLQRRSRRGAGDVDAEVEDASAPAEVFEERSAVFRRRSTVGQIDTDGFDSRRTSSYSEAVVAEDKTEFAATAFALDATAENPTLRMQSVRRGNPAYTASIFIENNEADSSGI